ncbi:MAG: nucleotidyltransferase domain-containing protein [Gemmataceae bacterium]
MRLIRRYAQAIAAEFHPERIILFGSYASGTPHEGSDVDLLVVMPTRDEQKEALRIRWRLAAPFPVDLLVRTPKEVGLRLARKESFTTTIVSTGKLLYEEGDEGMGQKSGQGLHRRARSRRKRNTST